MAVRELNGWSQSSRTYDVDGNLVSVTVAEPRFTPGEKALLLAARRKSLDPRGPHGWLLSEATDPANQFAFKSLPPVTDHVALALSNDQRAWSKKHPDADPNTQLWRVERR